MPKKFKKLVVLIIGLLFILFVLYLLNSFEIIKRYSNEEFNKQLVGNLFVSKFNILPNYFNGFFNASPELIEFNISEKYLKKVDQIFDSLYSYSVIYWRFLHYFGREQSFTYIKIPDISYKKAELIYNKKKYNVKIKLSGGQLDHFDTKKFSIRAKFNHDTLLGMSKFNLYNPKAREGGIYEWVGHKLMKDAGLIFLQTGYLQVRINNENKGIYFYQESPSRQMLNTNKRSFGLLFKILEDSGKWIISDIYNEDQFADSSKFNTQLRYVKTLINKINRNETQFSDIFSIEKMARFYAVIDLINGVHGAYFENCYLYFNPEDSLFEPIGKEFATNFVESAIPLKISKTEKLIISYGHWRFNSLVDSSFIKNKVFMDNYIQYLKVITDSSYLENFFSILNQELLNRQMSLHYSNPYFPAFSPQHYFDNQKRIKSLIFSYN